MEHQIRENLERKIKKMENTASLSEQRNKYKSDQDEARLTDLARRIDEFEQKLRILESKHSHTALDITEQLESTDKHLETLKHIPEVKREIENIRYGLCLDDRVSELEADMNSKMLSLCETMEEVIRNNSEKEKEILKLKEEIEQMKFEENEMVEKLRKYIEAMINVYENRNHEADEEMFLNLIK